MRDPLLAIEVHEVARGFTLRTRLMDLDPEVVPGDGDSGMFAWPPVRTAWRFTRP
jgi:hypothetical protein